MVYDTWDASEHALLLLDFLVRPFDTHPSRPMQVHVSHPLQQVELGIYFLLIGGFTLAFSAEGACGNLCRKAFEPQLFRNLRHPADEGLLCTEYHCENDKWQL